MPKNQYLQVSDLTLDLENFRTVPQKKEQHSLHSMIAISPEKFWALTESLLNDGYHPTENIIVLKSGAEHVVKEGNRRVGALKLALGLISSKGIDVPAHLEEKIKALTAQWKSDNGKVPCSIFASDESEFVDRLVALTHGKGEKAGREDWNAVARARHNRDKQKMSEPALDVLEKYLKTGSNVDTDQRERWAGDYPLSVLDEAIKRLSQRVGTTNARDLADQYPKIKYRSNLDQVFHDIGLSTLDFKTIRSSADFGAAYGFPAPPVAQGATGAAATVNRLLATSNPGGSAGGPTGAASQGASVPARSKILAVATNDPRSVSRKLRRFVVKGINREKVVSLLEEIRSLKLEKYPHAFCFLLRSMFEISGKVYGAENGIQVVKSDGFDRQLVDVLRDVAADLIKKNAQMKKELTGAIAELATPDGFLSVTSLNQLVHNKSFSVNERHISTLFHNVFPLLEAMNR